MTGEVRREWREAKKSKFLNKRVVFHVGMNGWSVGLCKRVFVEWWRDERGEWHTSASKFSYDVLWHNTVHTTNKVYTYVK